MYSLDMRKRSRKSRQDVNQLAKSIVQQATDTELVEKAISEGKNPAAVLLGRRGGLKGGRARAEKLTAKQRKEIAKKAAAIRWNTKQ